MNQAIAVLAILGIVAWLRSAALARASDEQ